MELKNEKKHTDNFKESTGLNFNEYYTKYYPKLAYTIGKFNINSIDAEAIANEAFMRSLEKIDQYNPKYQYSTWLFNIAKNIALKFINDESKLVCVDTSKTNEDTEGASYQYYLNTQIDESDLTESYEDLHAMKYAETLKEISNLSPKYKRIIEMCDIYGLTYNQISEETGESLQTVKNRLHHGRKKIQNNLKAKFELLLDNY